MRKIKIIKGQNFGIHVEKKIEKENFFFHEYEMAVEHLNHIWDSQTACLQVQDDLFVENPNNVIAFCGERGSGKSSAMLSFINALRQVGKNDDEFDFSNPVRNNNWDSKVIIDPSAFDGVHNIVDIVLAHIFQSFNDAYQEDNQSFDKYDRERLYKLMAKVYKNLSIIKNKEKMVDDEYDEAGNIAKLQKLGESTQLKKTLGELINAYLEMISKVKCRQGQKCEKLLIAIDDLDLCNEHAYEMAEQIRKYLILPNVIIFMAIKIDQLKLGIEEKNRKDFKNVIAGHLNSETIASEISDMSQRYLTKLIPAARRISLPNLNAMDFCLEIDEEADNRNLNNFNAEKTILKMIREKTGMIFCEAIENNYSYFVPENMREFVNFIILLCGMKTPWSSAEGYLQNIRDFKEYFINEMLKAQIVETRFNGLKEVLDSDNNTKNHNMKVYLDNLLLNSFRGTTATGFQYDYPETSLGAVMDGLNNVAAYLTKKEDQRLLYYLRIYYTIILNQSFLEKKKIGSFPDELTGSFIFGSKINVAMPASIINNGAYVSRGRFTIDIKKCWEVICNKIPLSKFSLEDELIDVFSINKYNRLYVKGKVINEDNKWRLASGWILMATLVSSINYAADGKTYVLDVPFIYENRLVYSVWVSPSIENFLGALCNMKKTVENACLQLLGFSQKDVENIFKNIIAENEKIISVARKIALNPDLSMRLLEYCQKKRDDKDSQGELRTYQLYKKFFKNVQSFLLDEKLEVVDMTTLWIPIEKSAEEGKLIGEKVDICELYAEMYESQRESFISQNDDNSRNDFIEKIDGQKLKQNFSLKVTNVARTAHEGKINSIPTSLRNKTTEWVKKKLEDIADYIEDYSYKNNTFPVGFENNLLIQLYSEVVDLYMQNPKSEISVKQYDTYKKFARIVNQNVSSKGE